MIKYLTKISYYFIHKCCVFILHMTKCIRSIIFDHTRDVLGFSTFYYNIVHIAVPCKCFIDQQMKIHIHSKNENEIFFFKLL